jgi:hypothetical protein
MSLENKVKDEKVCEFHKEGFCYLQFNKDCRYQKILDSKAYCKKYIIDKRYKK